MSETVVFEKITCLQLVVDSTTPKTAKFGKKGDVLFLQLFAGSWSGHG